MEDTRNKAFIEFCDLVGGTNSAADILGISPHTVSSYRRGVRRVPVDLAPLIEQHSDGKIKKDDLVWP